MPRETDDKFYDRADAHIRLSNDQTKDTERGKVSASMMYGTARFNAWISACGFDSGKEMVEGRKATIEYFVDQYRRMFEENFDDYAEHFAKYMKNAGEKA